MKGFTEKDLQKYIAEYLRDKNGFLLRKANCYNPHFAMDTELLFKFLYGTQPIEMAQLEKIYKDKTEETIANFINCQILNTSLIESLINGVYIHNIKLNLLYSKPTTTYNKALTQKYDANILSVMREVPATNGEFIDFGIFLNGLAIFGAEAKFNLSGQDCHDAIRQYREERNSKSRFHLFKSGCLVNFAFDANEVYMTTKLQGKSTMFLPFNKGKGEGIDAGAGNPDNPNGFNTAYLWEEIWTKDSIVDILTNYILLLRTTNKNQKIENIIFPRFHQLEAIRNLLADVYVNKTATNYLIQASAGSGKTYMIARLSEMLSVLHDENNKIIFDSIVIVSDKIVVDRQLQKELLKGNHKVGFVKIMDDNCSSADLKKALNGNTKIIVTTIQKFLYIVDSVKDLKQRNFAVIIDEAHSSTSGKDMEALTKTLGSSDENLTDVQDIIDNEIASNGKQPNVSMFAFTATPKPTTLKLFGRLNNKGLHEAFYTYSMKQAIEEGFIINVLQSVVEYNVFYKLVKKTDNDPKYKKQQVYKQAQHIVSTNDLTLMQEAAVIVDHFVRNKDNMLEGLGKAMVVTDSRASAFKLYNHMVEYINRQGYADIHPIIAFSGKLTDMQLGEDGDGVYTEASINGFKESQLPEKFASDEYNILIAANKYQTGFDEPKLCSMYVLKKLRDVVAVQTLSRLNRICQDFDKKVFVLDFVNTAEELAKAFAPYYTNTQLINNINPDDIYTLADRVYDLGLFSYDDVDAVANLYYSKDKINAKKAADINKYMLKSKTKFSQFKDYDARKEALSVLGGFTRFYDLLIKASSFSDVNIHKLYRYVQILLPELKTGDSGIANSLKKQLDIIDVYHKAKDEKIDIPIMPNPYVRLPNANKFLIPDEEKRLSEIISEINAMSGYSVNADVATQVSRQIKELMLQDSLLKLIAKNNTFDDFQLAFYDDIDNKLLECRIQNQEFCDMLLSNPEYAKKIVGIFVKDIYENLTK